MSEEFRRQAEAREWVRRTQGDPVLIRALLERIERKRGKAAADLLREDMRIAWVAAKGAG